MFVFCYKAVKTASIRSNSGAVQAGLNVDAEAAALENTLRDLYGFERTYMLDPG